MVASLTRRGRTACGSPSVDNVIELEELGDAQCRWCCALTLELYTETFQDHSDQGQQYG